MNIKVKWYFDIISDIGNDVTVAIGVSIGKSKPTLGHIMAGKYWDVMRSLEDLG
ncbi:hypothetical protein [Sporosarcina sp. FSL W7-1283]|uniref:hypothetical protein n=1 Tax=Sporosarcina sp. FSL W7-1283 TaxID=2921560 RepID=UPI0030F7A8FF